MRALVWIGVAASTAGCFTHNISLNGAPVPNGPPDHKRWHHHLIAGLVNLSPDLQPHQMCGGNAAFVRVDRGVIHYILAGITQAIYTPTVEYVWCAAGDTVGAVAPQEPTPVAALEVVEADVSAAVDLVVQDQQAAALDTL